MSVFSEFCEETLTNHLDIVEIYILFNFERTLFRKTNKFSNSYVT